MPTFVVLRHESPQGLHWDLMLETGEVLATWAVEEEPHAAGPLVATRLADHRRAYLDYEGTISRGRGNVSRWDCGTYELLECSEDRLRAQLHGGRLHGLIVLERATVDDDRWSYRYFSG